jgi:hypothetical protein
MEKQRHRGTRNSERIFDTSDGVLIEHSALTDAALKFQIDTYKPYDKKK